MTAIAARLRPAWRAAQLRTVEVVGRAVGAVGRTLPGIAGPLSISYGAWLAWAPLGFAVLGTFLLVLDRRIP